MWGASGCGLCGCGGAAGGPQDPHRLGLLIRFYIQRSATPCMHTLARPGDIVKLGRVGDERRKPWARTTL